MEPTAERPAEIEALLRPELILYDPPAGDKAGIVLALARAVCGSLAGLSERDLLQALSERERMGSVALGKGIAFCHARTDKVPKLTIALAVCPRGAAGFEVPDGVPIKIVLLFLIAKQHSDLYLRVMSSLLKELSVTEVMDAVLAAGSPEAVDAILRGKEAHLDLDAVANLFSMASSGGEPAAEVLSRTPPAYLAELLEDLPPSERSRFLARLEPSRAGAILERMHLIPAGAALRRLDATSSGRMLGYVNVARAADLVQQLRPEEQSAIIKHMSVRGGRDVQAVLKYPASTAGGLMTPEVLSVRDDDTIANAIKAIAACPDKRQTDVYVVTPEGRLAGRCFVHDLLSADPAAKASSVMHRVTESIPPEQERESIRHMVARGDTRSIPVLGPDETLVGVVTQDDILEVIEEQAGEDLLRIGGSTELVDPLHTPIRERIRMRMPWLLLTLGGELFIALVISKIFAHTLEKAVVLAAFIPAIMATGGNVGLQSTTMVIRSLGMGTLKPRHTVQLVLGEVQLGILTGLGCGLIAAVVAGLINWGHAEVLKIGVSVFLAMCSATLATSFVGTLEPIILHKLNFDPATACGPFVTMFNDIFGSIVYLLIATVMNFKPPH